MPSNNPQTHPTQAADKLTTQGAIESMVISDAFRSELELITNELAGSPFTQLNELTDDMIKWVLLAQARSAPKESHPEQILQAALIERGWAIAPSNEDDLKMCKQIKTAYGDKTVKAIIDLNADESVTLRGEFIHEGHNVLRAVTGHVTHGTPIEKVLNLVAGFTNYAEEAIPKAYAMQALNRRARERG